MVDSMRIEIESTEKIVELDGVPARVWDGKTDSGIPVHVFVTRISPQTHENIEQFEAELKEQKVPSASIASYPMRLIL